MGRGSGGTKGAPNGNSANPTGGAITAAKIDKTPFTTDGLGQWEIDIPGAGGGSILLNDTYGQYGATKYETTFWDKDYKMEDKKEFATLNAAKQYVKDEMKKRL